MAQLTKIYTQLSFIYRFIKYILWLIKEITLSALNISKLIWNPTHVNPDLGFIKSTLLNNEVASVIYANSITLTPGTITVSLQKGELLVHALQSKNLEELEGCEMEGNIKQLISKK